jgi:hypothetical protein
LSLYTFIITDATLASARKLPSNSSDTNELQATQATLTNTTNLKMSNATAANSTNASVTTYNTTYAKAYAKAANAYPTNRISYRAFNSYANKSEDFENVSKIPRNLKKADYNSNNSKKFSLKCKDARLSYKNRRSINKDWKDFNQS